MPSLSPDNLAKLRIADGSLAAFFRARTVKTVDESKLPPGYIKACLRCLEADDSLDADETIRALHDEIGDCMGFFRDEINSLRDEQTTFNAEAIASLEDDYEDLESDARLLWSLYQRKRIDETLQAAPTLTMMGEVARIKAEIGRAA